MHLLAFLVHTWTWVPYSLCALQNISGLWAIIGLVHVVTAVGEWAGGWKVGWLDGWVNGMHDATVPSVPDHSSS